MRKYLDPADEFHSSAIRFSVNSPPALLDGLAGTAAGATGQGAAGVGGFRPRVGRVALRRVERAAVVAAAVRAAAAAATAERLGFAAGAAVGQQEFAVGEFRRRQLAPPPPARPHLIVQAPADRLHLPHLLRRWRQLLLRRSPLRRQSQLLNLP